MSNNPITPPDYTNSILNVSNSLLKYYHVPNPHPTHKTVDTFLNTQYDHIIYLLLDGLGTNIIKYHLNKSDTLYTYMQEEITSVFPPTTVAATNAVISGRAPIENGHLGWVQYFKKEDTNLVVFKNEDFYTGHKPSENLRDKYLRYDRLVDQIKAKNPHLTTREFMPNIVDPKGPKTFKEQVERVLLHTHNHDQTFSYVYWVEPDLSQHEYGIDSDEIHTLLKELNEEVTSLINQLPQNSLLVGIADHGLTNVEPLPLYDNPELNNLLQRKTSIEPRATNFFVKPHKHDAFEKIFQSSFGDYYQLYTKEDLRKSHLLGNGKEHPMLESFLGDYLAIATSNKMFTLSDKKQHKAHHAGLTEAEMMVPLILYKK
ncbi:MAG: alkaline phosphatase family protein [Candidatus Izemoplasma sp.]|nr:alkaline phosphatase family protein [Candidatus Izemoplasma sp.]